MSSTPNQNIVFNTHKEYNHNVTLIIKHNISAVKLNIHIGQSKDCKWPHVLMSSFPIKGVMTKPFGF